MGFSCFLVKNGWVKLSVVFNYAMQNKLQERLSGLIDFVQCTKLSGVPMGIYAFFCCSCGRETNTGMGRCPTLPTPNAVIATVQAAAPYKRGAIKRDLPSRAGYDKVL